jgi:trans-aconitate methyltransferase
VHEDAGSPPTAITRLRPLLLDPPDAPDVANGYLDLLGAQAPPAPGSIQAAWESSVGSALYTRAQGAARRWVTATRLPASVRRPPYGARVLDVGCGPGDVTAALGRAVGAEGLAIGMDVSVPMLTRAVRERSAANVGFVRADARRPPFRDSGLALVTCLAALQLIPSPMAVLAGMTRVLAPGGQLAVMVPTVRGGLFDRLTRVVGGRSGLAFFDPGQVAGHLHRAGLATVHTHQRGPLLWIVATKET